MLLFQSISNLNERKQIQFAEYYDFIASESPNLSRLGSLAIYIIKEVSMNTLHNNITI